MKTSYSFLLVFLAVCLLAACDAPRIAEEATVTPSLPPEPTNTPEPTETPLPTETPTLTPVPLLPTGERIEAPLSGFSVLAVEGAQYVNGRTYISLFDDQDTYYIYLIAFPADGPGGDAETELDAFLEWVMEYDGSTIERGDLYPISVAGMEGVAADFTGDTMFSESLGKIVVAEVSEGYFWLGFVAIDAENDPDTTGLSVYATLLETVEFFDPPPFTESACEVSTDPSYGYEIGNPIKVGGTFFDGPSRERAYLDSLIGPNGEFVTYERQGSLDGEEAILDAYLVAYGNIEVILYIDMYNYEAPIAPVDFACWQPILLEQP